MEECRSGHNLGKARGRMAWCICGIIRRLVGSLRKKKICGSGLCPNLPLRAPNNFIFCIATVEKEEHRLKSEEFSGFVAGECHPALGLSNWSNRQDH